MILLTHVRYTYCMTRYVGGIEEREGFDFGAKPGVSELCLLQITTNIITLTTCSDPQGPRSPDEMLCMVHTQPVYTGYRTAASLHTKACRNLIIILNTEIYSAVN